MKMRKMHLRKSHAKLWRKLAKAIKDALPGHGFSGICMAIRCEIGREKDRHFMTYSLYDAREAGKLQGARESAWFWRRYSRKPRIAACLTMARMCDRIKAR